MAWFVIGLTLGFITCCGFFLKYLYDTDADERDAVEVRKLDSNVQNAVKGAAITNIELSSSSDGESS